MQKRISPVPSISGAITLPGDKSISHRYAMLAAIAGGATQIRNYSTGADCASTLRCVQALGVEVERSGTEVVVRGRGPHGLREPSGLLDAGNSGSTIRMLSGILSAQPFRTRIAGDESLARRPMDRIMRPLSQMGARITARDGKYPPLDIEGGALRAIDYQLPVPSAQVKTCVLLAGLYADGETVVRESVRSRDHTEVALREFGAEISVERGVIRLQGGAQLSGRDLYVPSDLSSAAFFIVAALLLPGSRLIVRGVGLNPTRSTLLDVLMDMGARIRVLDLQQTGGEPVGDILVEHAPVRGGTIEGETTAALIDEIPVLAVLGATSEEGLSVRDAAELRIKETDRIATVAENLRRAGVQVEETPDGMTVPGRQTFSAAQFDSFGDHRIAMAFAVAALRCDGECAIDGAEAASVSFPEFYGTLEQLTTAATPG
jgi:3-phosphoshikimate 1-carboxyvinyltransferase